MIAIDANARHPRVFVVTPCRNAERTIAVAIESVLAQERLARYRIVDGASTDGTLEVIRRYSAAGAIETTSEPDTGIYDAMNKGLKDVLLKAEPDDLIGILNADDAYVADAFHRVTQLAAARPDVDIFFGDIEFMSADGASTGHVRHAVPELIMAVSLDGMPIAHPAMFARARTYVELGLYDARFRIAADYDFVLRALERGVTTLHVPEVLARFREGGVSTADELPSFKEAIRVRVAHGSNATFEWSRYYKRRLVARVFAALAWIPGVKKLQSRFGASARRPK